jgi:hypothetical protein
MKFNNPQLQTAWRNLRAMQRSPAFVAEQDMQLDEDRWKFWACTKPNSVLFIFVIVMVESGFAWFMEAIMKIDLSPLTWGVAVVLPILAGRILYPR